MANFTLATLDAILERTAEPRPTLAIETGTWTGDTTAILAERFDEVVTVDIERTWAEAAEVRFTCTPNVTAIQGDSAAVLPELLAEADAYAFLYLDAHWWGDYGGSPDRSPFPLWAELRAAVACPLVRVVVVDDVMNMGNIACGNPGWAGATQRAILNAMVERLDTYEIVGDQLVAWLTWEAP